MAIARIPSASSGMIMSDSIVATEPIQAFMAVGIVDDNGEQGLKAVGCDYFGNNFVGFSSEGVLVGNNTRIITHRGSILPPLREGGVLFNVGDSIYLSKTPGYVTNVLPTIVHSDTSVLIQLGIAVSPTRMQLITDLRVTM